MWFNYLKLAFRTLARNKVYSFVSILGLSLGISASMLIALYIGDELSYESVHEKNDRIYRAYVDLIGDNTIRAGLSPMSIGPTLKNDYPEFQAYSRFVPMGQEVTIRVGERIFKEENFWFADSSFFEIFSYQFIHGDPATALVEPKSIVLSQSMVRKFFNTDQVIDSTVKVNNNFYTVKGVVEDPPLQTEVGFNGLVSLTTWPTGYMQQTMSDWYWLSGYTYFLSHQPLDEERRTEITAEMKETYVEPFKQANGVSQDGIYYLRPLKGLRFYTEAEYDHPKGNKSYLYIFGLVGLFILIIASINFINLSLAQSGKRSVEVGLRKTLGATRSELRLQFLGESLLVAFLATLVGWALVEVAMPVFNDLTGKEFAYSRFLRLDFIVGIALMWLIVGLLSGIYPAVVLSAKQAVDVLKSNGRTSASGLGGLRKFLVVVQFTFSILMIIGTMIVFQQMQFMRNQNLGFRGEQVMSLEIPSDTFLINHAPSLKQQLESLPEVEEVSLSRNFPGRRTGELLFRIEQDGALSERGIKFMAIDEDFLDVYEIELHEGRNFRNEGGTDALNAFIINETAVERFGWKGEALGKRMQQGLFAGDSAAFDGKVVGVVEDFHFSSLHNPMEPLVLRYSSHSNRLIAVKLKPDQISAGVNSVGAIWTDYSKGFPFDYRFVDDEFDALYRSEEQMLTIFAYFSFISIFIAVLGLFALSSYSIEQRTKEIGVRKILGASTGQIIRLLLQDFIPLVVIAMIIATPVSIFLLRRWLQDFAYAVDMSPLVFIMAGLISLSLAGLTVGYHGLKASRSNPVNALRNE